MSIPVTKDARQELVAAVAEFDQTAGPKPSIRLVNAIEDMIDARVADLIGRSLVERPDPAQSPQPQQQ